MPWSQNWERRGLYPAASLSWITWDLCRSTCFSFPGRSRLPGFKGIAAGVEKGFGNAAAADFADLDPDAVDDRRLPTFERVFAAVVHPIVERGIGWQVGAELLPLEVVAELLERDSAPDHKLSARGADVLGEAVEFVLDVSDQL